MSVRGVATMATAAVVAISLAALQAARAEEAEPGDEIARWIAALGEPDWDRREEAMERIARIGEAAIPALEEAAHADDLEVARRANILLERIRLSLANRAGIWESLVVLGPWSDSSAFAGATIRFFLQDGKPAAHWVVHGSGVPVVADEVFPVELDGFEVRVNERRFLFDRASEVLLDRACARHRLFRRDVGQPRPEEATELQAQEPHRVRDALWRLVQPGAPEADEVVRRHVLGLLAHPETEVRAQAAHVAGWWRLGSGTERLRELLDDPDPRVRRESAEALGRLGDQASADRIARLAEDPDATVREHVRRALAELSGTPK